MRSFFIALAVTFAVAPSAIAKPLWMKSPNSCKGETSPTVLRRLSQSHFHHFCLLKNPNTPSDVIARIVNQGKITYSEKLLISHPNTPPEVLAKLAQDKRSSYRDEVATHPNVALETLKKLSQVKDSTIRVAVAKSKNTTSALLAQLSQDESLNVRIAVAKNPNTPKETLRQLAKNKSWKVRQAVAKNPNTSEEIAEVIRKRKQESPNEREETTQTQKTQKFDEPKVPSPVAKALHSELKPTASRYSERRLEKSLRSAYWGAIESAGRIYCVNSQAYPPKKSLKEALYEFQNIYSRFNPFINVQGINMALKDNKPARTHILKNIENKTEELSKTRTFRNCRPFEL